MHKSTRGQIAISGHVIVVGYENITLYKYNPKRKKSKKNI